MFLGAQISVAGGYDRALEYALSVGCECIQVFAKSPRQWRAPSVDATAARGFLRKRQEVGFGPVFTHTAYLLNLSTTNEELYDKSVVALADELVRGSMLGAEGVVTHIGNVPDGDRDAAAVRVAQAVVRAFERAGESACTTRLLLENTAGAGSTFGRTFAEIGACISASGLTSSQLGMCLDTCHAFAFGYPVDTEQGWQEVTRELAAEVGLERVGLIHANDCKFERGTNHDRHEWIGEGHIGIAGFEAMLCAPDLANVPIVTEMPGDVPEKDAINVGRLRELRERCAPSQ